MRRRNNGRFRRAARTVLRVATSVVEGGVMKAWGWVVVVSILSSPTYADSLGDVAKREQERREKKKRQGPQTETKVIHDEDLLAAPGKDSKGTFSPGTGFVSGRASRLPAPSSSPSSSGGTTEVDVIRAGARQRLESSYERIGEIAQSLVQAVVEYQQCGEPATSRCRSLVITIENLAMSVGLSMEDAEEAARQGWLNPGDVRAVRQRYGMDDALWDKLVRYVHQYRR